MHQHFAITINGFFDKIDRIFQAIQQICIILVKDVNHMVADAAWDFHIKINRALQDVSPV